MKKIFIIALVLVGLYGCWQVTVTTGSWNYRLTLVVQTPEGIKTGSAVRKVYARNDPSWFPESNHGHASVEGEAVVVDLGERGILFALLRSEASEDYGHYIVFDAFNYTGALTPNGIKFYSTLQAKKELSFDKLPMLVRFRDINDPMTVERVDPKDLEKTFGKGVKLLSATIEMTDDSVTNEIEKYLRWWVGLNGEYLNSGSTSRNAPLGLHGGNFKKGVRYE